MKFGALALFASVSAQDPSNGILTWDDDDAQKCYDSGRTVCLQGSKESSMNFDSGFCCPGTGNSAMTNPICWSSVK